MGELNIRPVHEALVFRGLHRARIQNGYKLADLTSVLGVDRSSASRLLTGNRRPWDSARLAQALGVTVAELLTPCQHCGYIPPAGYTCNDCGSSSSILAEIGMGRMQFDVVRRVLIREFS